MSAWSFCLPISHSHWKSTEKAAEPPKSCIVFRLFSPFLSSLWNQHNHLDVYSVGNCLFLLFSVTLGEQYMSLKVPKCKEFQVFFLWSRVTHSTWLGSPTSNLFNTHCTREWWSTYFRLKMGMLNRLKPWYCHIHRTWQYTDSLIFLVHLYIIQPVY